MTKPYPDDALQCVFDEWWTEDPPRRGTFNRGRLVWVPALDIKAAPTELSVEGHDDQARDHTRAKARMRAYHVGRRQTKAALPAAGAPLHDGELCLVHKAKRRPALILGTPPPPAAALLADSTSHSPILVAPYYDCAGYPPEFLARVRRAEYPQFMWEQLPLDAGPGDAVLRMDQIQPVGRSIASCEETPWCLSSEALEIIEQWVSWLLVGAPPAGSVLEETREFMLEL